MSARRALPLTAIDVEALVRAARSLEDCEAAMRQALAALILEPVGTKKSVWSSRQAHQRAAARVRLRAALGISD